MTKLIFIFGILFTFQCFGQEPRINSLLVAEYQKNEEGIGNYTHLLRYKFVEGKLNSRDTILSAPTFKGQGSYVRYDLGHNFIYKNRYVISATGNVIDVRTKSLVMEESDELIETRGDSIVFRRDNIFTGTGYLICDLNNRTYDFVKDKNFLSVKGIHSPNHTMGLEIDQSELPYKILLYNKNNKKEIIVSNCGSGTLLSNYASTIPKVPLLWINNNNFLYATFSYSRHNMESINATVTIHEYNVERKSSEIITIVDSVPPAVSNAGFSIDPEHKIIFYCAKGKFVIDTKNKQSTPINMISVNNNFSIENNRNEEYGSIITFRGKEIGKIWCNSYNAKTISGFIAVEYGDVGSNLGYPKGVRVWNDITKNWIDIEIPWIAGLVGWIVN